MLYYSEAVILQENNKINFGFICHMVQIKGGKHISVIEKQSVCDCYKLSGG